MKRVFLSVICVLIIAVTCFAFTSCKKEAENTQPTKAVVYYDNLEEINTLLGFDVKVPKSLRVESYGVKNSTTIEVIFDGGYIRKAKTIESVGNTNENAETKTVEIGENDVTFEYVDGKVRQATWFDGSFSYCLGFISGENEDAVTDLVESIK
ncbi:MAG: hypothetical protein E7571_03390 [Ruminococcaceae bacterium]|nr:hypothetical protein [Oscillospiraceae bacterium]